MAESAVTFLVHRLSTLLNGGPKVLEGVQQEIAYIRDEFEKLRAFSRVADAKDEEEDAELQVWIKQVQDLAHDVQDILEKHVVMMCANFQEKGSWPWKRSHHPLMSEKLVGTHNDNLLMMLEGVKARIIAISQGQESFLQKYGVITSDTWCSNDEEVVLDDDSDLVGTGNLESVLVDWLLSDDPEWKLHCVVGTGGVGKTALVKRIYGDPAVTKNFDLAIWLDIPRYINLKDLLMSFIDLQNDNTRQTIEAMDDNMLAQSVQRYFESLRYLAVLDDVPDIDTWRRLKGLFPSKTRSCRVIIISRFAEICHTICVETGGDSRVCSLNPLSENESQILFCRKAFSGSSFHPPPSLMQISKDIVEKCNGLPMAILLIAGVLATKGNGREAWELFHDSLVDKLQGSHTETEYMKRLLNLCYQDLPFYLKSCFTYLSIIPKYHVIDKMRLIQQWAAEGLVVEREGKSIAQVAESYLNELANRRLIQVAKKYPDGRLETFTIHNSWYEIIHSKSGEETINPQKVRHLVMTDKLVIYMHDVDRFKYLHSLITLDYSFPNSFLLKLFTGSFKLLKVLDLQGSPLVNVIPEEFFELVHLKFLNLRNTEIKTLPRSIPKLESLEFLDLRETLVDKLPDEILRLQHLRHILVYRWGSAGFSHGFEAP